jgi:MFS family permease
VTSGAVRVRTPIGRPLVALLAADVISTAGSEMAAVALPWFALITTGSPARMAGVMAAEFLGTIVFGIASGRLATSLGPRTTMLVSDAVRAPLAAVIPLLHWLGVLHYPVLIAVAFGVGSFFPAYQSSQRLVLSGLVNDDELRLTRVGGVLNSVNESASFIGPALGGLLIALIGPAQVLLVDSASYLAAFALIAAFIPRGGRSESTVEGSAKAIEGVRYVVRERPLLWTVAGLSVIEIGWTALMATLPVLALHRYHAGPRLAGLLIAAYGGGSVVGGLIASRATRIDDRRAQLALVGAAVSALLMLVPLPAWWMGLCVVANGICSGLFFPRFFAALTVRTPAALRARVMATVTTVLSAPGPIGFIAAGLLLQYAASPSFSLALVAGATALGALIVVSAARAA